MDAIFNDGSGIQVVGNVGQRLLACGFDANALRPYRDSKDRSRITKIINGKPTPVPTTNATLRKDEWKTLDEAIVKIKQERLQAITDLQSRGLTVPIANGMGTTIFEYEDQSDITGAQMSMDGLSRSEGDRPQFTLKSLPLPITHKDFQINARVLESSRTRGMPLDTTMVEQATRRVSELIEETLVTGASLYSYGGGVIYGYTDYTNRVTGSLTADWDASATTGAQILADVLSMKQASIAVKCFGPWMLYIPTAYETVIDGDFKANSDKTIRQRILEIKGIAGITVLDKLTANNVVMVQLTSDVVRLVEAMQITVVEWDTQGGFAQNFKVMGIIVPQLRADQDGNTGIIHYT